jgi:hypothetical protein
MASSKLIEKVLADDRWFGEGAPRWQDAPTEEDAMCWRTLSIRRLRLQRLMRELL